MSNNDGSLNAKLCIAEIEAVMKKYECGGFVALADPDGGEYKFVNPEWSVLDDGGSGSYLEKSDAKYMFRHRRAEHQRTVSTVHMLQVMENVCQRTLHFSKIMLDLVKTKMEVTGGPELLDQN